MRNYMKKLIDKVELAYFRFKYAYFYKGFSGLIEEIKLALRMRKD